MRSKIDDDNRALRVGIATPKQMKERLLAVARGEYLPGPDEPKLWMAPEIDMMRSANEFTRAAFAAWLDKHRSMRKDAAEQPRQMTLRETVDALRAIPGSGWKDIDDPLAELRRMRGGDEISGLDAHFLLFAVDAYVATDQDGRVTEPRNGLSLEGWQKIRDCLFEMHEHPETMHEP